MGHGININYNANKWINFYFGARANNNRSTSYSNIIITKYSHTDIMVKLK